MNISNYTIKVMVTWYDQGIIEMFVQHVFQMSCFRIPTVYGVKNSKFASLKYKRLAKCKHKRQLYCWYFRKKSMSNWLPMKFFMLSFKFFSKIKGEKGPIKLSWTGEIFWEEVKLQGHLNYHNIFFLPFLSCGFMATTKTTPL